ncbi:SPOC like C-terminal domain-containing protein [Russula ochroleuca]|jgi:ATP-dependent DNA helicase 2 subunit 1|uniref:ATP-dependent DNA helicase II subunit 1 n=1 Tax=Russula ochroleuca TaxID=152965 RepID=A0A9P5JWL9_9AGAM|nr:SPOC like C-terminal domain-containing protein [Russula ochroleuca]
MPSYDDWNKFDEDEDEELQDTSYFDRKHDVILFAIDCSQSMLALRGDPNYENTKTSRLLTALDAAVQIQKRKVVVGPYDSVGIMLYNTTRRNESGPGSEIKKGTYVYQPLSVINAPKILDLNQLIDEARDNPDLLSEDYPSTDKHIPVGDLFTSCNWVLRDGAPKSATKRVFLITDDDDPFAGLHNPRLITSARTTLIDLLQAGVSVEPFFISADYEPFNQHKFWTSILVSDSSGDDDADFLPAEISISRIDDLLEQMRFHEVPKRALFNIPFELATGLVIGIKGYNLITEQKKGSYRYFVDLGDKMEVVESRTTHVDEEREAEVNKSDVLFGMTLGATAEDEDIQEHGFGTRSVRAGRRVFYTTEEVRSLRTLDLEPGIKLLGFKDRSELVFEDNVRHSLFIFPDEDTYAGSRRTFRALLSSMVKKGKIGLVRALTRRNASPSFCALLPQEEGESEGWAEPSGFHLITLPFADDIRAAPIEEGFRAGKELIDAAKSFISKLALRNSSYPPDSYPNPALAFHYAQLEATAFREEFDPASFGDHTLPKNDTIRKKAGPLIKEWMKLLNDDKSADAVIVQSGSKRKPDVSVSEAEVRSRYETDSLMQLRVDQMKDFLKSRSLALSGKKVELAERISEWLDEHP